MPKPPKSDQEKFVAIDPAIAERQRLNLDRFETNLLSIARQIFANFDHPESHCWMTAFMEAERVFPAPFGATIAHAVSIIIRDLRSARQRPFEYFPVGSPIAEQAITPEERYFIQVIQSIRRGEYSVAQTQAMLLCEGGDVSSLLASAERLCLITGDVSKPRLQS